MERSAQVSRPRRSGARLVGREGDQTERHNLRGTDGQHSAGSRRARRPPLAVNTGVLTDAWNYVKVVVGSKLRLEVQMKSGHLAWATKEQTSKQIDLQFLFNDYWTTADEIAVKGPSWSTPSPCI